MSKEKNEGMSAKAVMDEAKKAGAKIEEKFDSSYWPSEEDVGEEDLPITESDGSPRRYWVNEAGQTLFGYYLGTEILTMPNFNKRDTMEERAFFVFEIADPPGYDAVKAGAAYAVKVKRPRSPTAEYAHVGDKVYVGIRTRLQNLTLLSCCDFQPLVGIRILNEEKTSRGFRVSMYDWKAWGSDRVAARKLAQSSDGDVQLEGLFSAQDRGLYAAKVLFNVPIPDRFMNIAYAQGVKQIAAPENDVRAIPAQASASA